MSTEREKVESLIERGIPLAPRPDPAVYQADPLHKLLAERQALTWTIEGWLEAGTLALVVGAEGSFKSFVVIDWAMCIATGREWNGYRVKPGRVLYVAGEGRTGVIRRMRGWCIRHRTGSVDRLLLGRSPIELTGSNDAERIAKLGEFDLVVIDTLARNFGGGNENDQKDMSAAIVQADRIRESTGATVLLVHHAPLEGREEGKLRPRGSSALSGAADAIFTTQFDKESKVITLAGTKQKDAPNPETLFLSFDVVELGDRDNFGNELTTVVLCPTHKRPAPNKRLGKHQRHLIKALRSQANGSPEVLVTIREITASMEIHQQTRKRLEEWFSEQPWVRPSVGGHIVEIESLPRV